MKNNVATAVRGLEMLRSQHENELERVNRALQALRPGKKTGRVLSAAARARISKAQRARWAEWKKHQKTVARKKPVARVVAKAVPKKEPAAAA